MKAFKVMFVVFAILLLAVPIVAAQESWAGCPWGSAYDPMVQGYVPACFSRPADNAAALKPVGLAAPAPVVAPEQGSRCVSYAGPNYSVCVVASSDTSAAAKPAGLAQAASTAKATPFQGSWDSSETPTFVPAPPPDATIMFVDGTASGNATQLGKYTAEFKAAVNLACGCSQGDSIHFIAANGDSLYGLGQGVGVPDKPGFNLVTQTYTIMGGTGRFVGATGNFIVIRLANNATGVSSGSFDGNIVLPRGK